MGCKTRKRRLSNANDKIKEFNVSPKLTVISDTGSNSETKDIFKVSDNSNVKLSGVIPEKNNTLDYDTLDKSSSAKCKTRKRRLSNANEVKDDCNVDYCLICDETGDLICCDFCPRAFHCECIGLKINDLPKSRWQCTMCKQKGRIMQEGVVKGKKSFKVISKAFRTLVISCSGSGKQLEILSKIFEMVQNILKYDFGSYFAEPIKLRSYCQAITDPKDLGTISKNILKGVYCQKILIRLSEKDELAESTSEKERNKVTTQAAFDEVILTVLRDVEKVWQNCFQFNEEESICYRMAQILRDKYYKICQCSFFEKLSPYIKHDLDKYIKECKASQQLRMDDECEASPKLTAIVENDSNIGTKSFSKASDNSNAKLSGAIPEKNNTLDYSTLDKKSSAKCKTRKRRLSNANDKIKECNVSPKLTVLSDTGSNSGTKGIFKVSDNSNVKLSGVIPEKNKTLDYDKLDKSSSAKCKTRKRGLSNANDRRKHKSSFRSLPCI